MKPESRAPLFLAIVLLLFPVLYVGSYLALVTPGKVRFAKVANVGPSTYQSMVIYETYRYGGSWSEILFWPLERVDRKVRPGAWELDQSWEIDQFRVPFSGHIELYTPCPS
ncbi:hypothetical protein [Anatilimnocola floriformis]|uniref:hypothetical protein n=1 Tax=Anatilimnocola floriformis TaxID=2948575 RepID=UPI0020C50915|nr:hypothetical protein [Anatilimnocola floriformis]